MEQAYEKLEKIGQGNRPGSSNSALLGSFGVVFKVRRISDGAIFVCKEMNYGRMNDREKKQIVAEVNILRGLSHPCIVKYVDRKIEKHQ